MTRIAFVGGGTGGHLTPAIGIAEELIARGHQVEFWLSGRKVEQNYVKSKFVQRSMKLTIPSCQRESPSLLQLRAFENTAGNLSQMWWLASEATVVRLLLRLGHGR